MKMNSFVLLVAVVVMMDTFQKDFGSVDFFQNHGYAFLVCISFFPRLTLLFSSVVTGGFTWWLGFFFCPRILVAALASVAYYRTNPALVAVSWIVAISGEIMEKKGISGGRNRFVFKMGGINNMGQHPFGQNPYQQQTRSRAEPQPIKKDDAIEAEFTRKE